MIGCLSSSAIFADFLRKGVYIQEKTSRQLPLTSRYTEYHHQMVARMNLVANKSMLTERLARGCGIGISHILIALHVDRWNTLNGVDFAVVAGAVCPETDV